MEIEIFLKLLKDHYQWIFSGIGVFILGLFFYKKRGTLFNQKGNGQNIIAKKVNINHPGLSPETVKDIAKAVIFEQLPHKDNIEITNSQQITILKLTDLILEKGKAIVRLTEEDKSKFVKLQEQQIEKEKLSNELENLRKELHGLYKLFPANYSKKLEAEEETLSLQQKSNEADNKQKLRKDLETKEIQRNAKIKYDLSVNQESLFKFSEALLNINKAIELWPDNLQYQLKYGGLLLAVGLIQKAEHVVAEIFKSANFNSSSLDLQKETWSRMGLIQLELHNPNQAITYFNKALDIQQKQHGKIIFLGAESLFSNLGAAYLKLRDYEQASFFINKSLEANTLIYGAKSLEVAQSLNNLGDLYKLQGKLDDAKAQFKSVLDIFKIFKIQVDPRLAILYDNLSQVHRYSGEFKESLAYARLSESIRIEIYGKSSIYTALSYLMLARVHKALKEDFKSLEYFTEAADIYKGKNKDSSHILNIEQINGLEEASHEIASILLDMGDYLNAITHLEIERGIIVLNEGSNSVNVAF